VGGGGKKISRKETKTEEMGLLDDFKKTPKGGFPEIPVSNVWERLFF
jgi:hypothetical protein